MLHILTFLNKFLTGNQDITSDKKDNLPYLIICSIDRTKRGQLACLSPDLIKHLRVVLAILSVNLHSMDEDLIILSFNSLLRAAKHFDELEVVVGLLVMLPHSPPANILYIWVIDVRDWFISTGHFIMDVSCYGRDSGANDNKKSENEYDAFHHS